MSERLSCISSEIKPIFRIFWKSEQHDCIKACMSAASLDCEAVAERVHCAAVCHVPPFIVHALDPFCSRVPRTSL